VWITNQHAATHSETVVWVVSNNTSAMSFSSHPARNDNFTFSTFGFGGGEKNQNKKNLFVFLFLCVVSLSWLYMGDVVVVAEETG
jgi:hypothetical protein